MLVLLFSVLSAYFCAGAFIIALQLSLPRADLAYGQSLGQAFSDPFVLTIASTGALVAGLVAFPVALVCLWNRDVLRCGVVVVGLTSVFLAVGTVLAPPLGLVGAPAIALAALLFCKFTRLPYFRHHEDSASVA
jgi:hypothetical protein